MQPAMLYVCLVSRSLFFTCHPYLKHTANCTRKSARCREKHETGSNSNPPPCHASSCAQSQTAAQVEQETSAELAAVSCPFQCNAANPMVDGDRWRWFRGTGQHTACRSTLIPRCCSHTHVYCGMAMLAVALVKGDFPGRVCGWFEFKKERLGQKKDYPNL